MKQIVVLVTVPTKKEARKISDELLKKKLAACVSLLPGVASSYWWEGKIEKSEEMLLIIKTKKDDFKALMRAVKCNHSYSVPEIIGFPIQCGSPDYLEWINKVTR